MTRTTIGIIISAFLLLALGLALLDPNNRVNDVVLVLAAFVVATPTYVGRKLDQRRPRA